MDELIRAYLNVDKKKRYALCLCVTAILLLFFVLFMLIPAHSVIKEKEEKIKQLAGEKEQKRINTEKMAYYEKKRDFLEKEMETAQKRLPEQADVAMVLSQIDILAKNAGLHIRRFEPKEEKQQKMYDEIIFEMDLKGSYHEIAMFIDSMNRLERIVSVGDVLMKDPVLKNKKMELSASLILKTFRFRHDGKTE